MARFQVGHKVFHRSRWIWYVAQCDNLVQQDAIRPPARIQCTFSYLVSVVLKQIDYLHIALCGVMLL